MKRVPLLSFSISLAVVGVGLLTKMQSTPADPAPIFQPILSDIRKHLPQGTEIRLPSTLPTYNRSHLSKAYSHFLLMATFIPMLILMMKPLQLMLA